MDRGIVAIALFLGLSALAHAGESAFKEIQFSASFSWNNGTMKFVAGQGTKGWAGRIVASDGKVFASCAMKSFESDGPSVPVAIRMECESADLGAFVTPVTLFFRHGAQTEPAIEFGSWLKGTRELPLRVEIDRYSVATAPLAVR